MTWIKSTDSTPAHYTMRGLVLSDDTWCGKNVDELKRKRKEQMQWREELLQFQKVCEKQKDFNTARYFREEAAHSMKRFRGYDLAIKIVENGLNATQPDISEPIAPFIDRAFYEIDLYE